MPNLRILRQYLYPALPLGAIYFGHQCHFEFFEGTMGNVPPALIIAVPARLIWHIYDFARSIIPILRVWPMRLQMVTLTKDDVTRSLNAPSRNVTEEDVCPFCWGPYIEPLELPCRHLYCKNCIAALIGSDEDKCGLCRQPYYDITAVALHAEARHLGMRAKWTLIVGLLNWLLKVVAQVLIVVYWKKLMGGPVQQGLGITKVHRDPISGAYVPDDVEMVMPWAPGKSLRPVMLFMMLEGSCVVGNKGLIDMKKRIDAFGSDSWRAIEVHTALDFFSISVSTAMSVVIVAEVFS